MKQRKNIITLTILLIGIIFISAILINIELKKDSKILNAQTLKSMTYNFLDG